MIRTAHMREHVEGERLDITIINNPNHVLSPTWHMVIKFKANKTSWPEYERQYKALMRERWKERRDDILSIVAIAKEKDIYLVCFCADERYCHRRLAKEFIDELIQRGY